jgi:hypothetical protein
MSTDLVPFVCPKHGRIGGEYPASALVEHDHIHCGQECAPEGETPREHRKKVATRRRVARHRATAPKALHRGRETAGQRVEESAMSPLSNIEGSHGAEAS